ncbi:MAG: hypothetical protein GWM90_11295, partial [Gemmatimonadetes bacterium]|nr:hypothetical protein [Gemmatimonadota bacterium]NIQ54569.1 hypothetical protein [Gemmatimonadota bacterium]NIU74772.1 hypothetical protein [Gammaproteobacteria bacterium]NIX44678.1 hypothetical protein [Gemmatimonadota bacterium]NIY08913.1 hypothetical protein [Gemmatimonadota bacterium]
QGTWTIGFDEIRLVDEQQPGASPVTYTPGPDAAFSSYPGSYRLYNGDGGWSGLQFSDVTGLDALIGAVF